jgi:hypothetical protein
VQILLKKLTVSQVVKESLAFYGTCKFNIMYTTTTTTTTTTTNNNNNNNYNTPMHL